MLLCYCLLLFVNDHDLQTSESLSVREVRGCEKPLRYAFLESYKLI